MYKARYLYNVSKEDIWTLPENTPIKIEFDDGIIITDNRRTIFSYYFGQFHRLFPDTPLLKHHHINDRPFTKGVELKILGECLWDCYDTYKDHVDMELLCEVAYSIINEIFNDFSVKLQSYISTISALDFIDVLDHPKIKAIKESTEPTLLGVSSSSEKIKKILASDEELIGNTLSRMIKYKLVDANQVLHCIGPGRFITDIDSELFRKPVMTNYAEGLTTLVDSMIESRYASKSLFFTKAPMANSEYFNREMQLNAAIVSRLHKGDCGTNEYVVFPVKAKDLVQLEGKYYRLSEDDPELHKLSSKDHHLINKIIYLRSPLKCKHTDAYGVCETCFGELFKSVPKKTNIGHVSASVMCEQMSQNILSTRHTEESSQVDDIYISEFDQKYIVATNDITEDKDNFDISVNNVIKLSEHLRGKNIQLIIAQNQAVNLPEIEYHDLSKLSPSTISTLEDVELKITDEDGFTEHVTISVSMGIRKSWLTHDALKYIKKTKWTLNERGHYVINFTDWNIDLPLFKLPLKHSSMVMYMNTVKSFITAARKSKSKYNRNLRDFETLDQALLEFYNLINSKLRVNIAFLEIIILSSMVNKVGEDHRLPRPITKGELGPFTENMKRRSLSVGMAHERQLEKLFDVKSFQIKKRPDSIFDNLLKPFPKFNPID